MCCVFLSSSGLGNTFNLAARWRACARQVVVVRGGGTTPKSHGSVGIAVYLQGGEGTSALGAVPDEVVASAPSWAWRQCTYAVRGRLPRRAS